MEKVLYYITTYFLIISLMLGLIYLEVDTKNLALFIWIIYVVFTITIIIFLIKIKDTAYIKQLSLYWILLFIFIALVLLCKGKSQQNFSLNPIGINSIQGRVISDSHLTENGNNVVNLELTGISSQYEETATANGIIAVIFKGDDELEVGQVIKAQGELYQEEKSFIFCANSFFVTEFPSKLLRFRKRLICQIRGRIFSKPKKNYQLLCIMLLLGRLEVPVFPLKELALKAGLYYVLALSGMHLHFFIFLFSPIAKKRYTFIPVFIVLVFFVFLAGPKASLLRALIFYLIIKRKGKDNDVFLLFLTGLLQILIFPFSMIGQGVMFSYFALIAIIIFSSTIKNILLLKSSVVAASIAAISFTAILSLAFYDYWNPWAMLFGTPAATTVFVYMLFSFLLVLFPTFSLLRIILGKLYKLIVLLFQLPVKLVANFFSTTAGYFIIFLFILTIMLTIKYTFKRRKLKRGKHELEFYIRFANRDY